MDNIFIQLAIILGIASILGFITVRLKLPLLIAYLFGGLLIATTAVFDPRTSEVLHFLPEIGIAFVLFLVGMELDLREIKSLGKPILLAGILQITMTTIIGSSIARLLGFAPTESLYLGVGLSFSSTILVIKLLLDKKDLNALYGKLAVGILLLEDLLAVILLLFLTALAWCFIYISFAVLMGFSVVIGAFLAGVALASSPYHYQIQGKVKPLRDFFVALFFVYLGTQVDFTDIGKIYPLALIFTAYTLFVKPAIFLLIFGIFGFRKHTMFQTALVLTHISEFSLIILLVGLQQAKVSQAALTTIALSGVSSMIIASLMITHSRKIYKKLSGFVAFFERKDYRHETEIIAGDSIAGHVVIIGGHRVGGEIVRFLKNENIPHLVLDFNPGQVEALLKEKINAFYGDMGDPDVLDELRLSDAKMVISTASDFDDNRLLLEEIKSLKINIPVIVRAETIPDARELYHAGADFCLIPDIVAGDLLMEKLKEHLNDDFFKNRAKIEMEKLARKTLAWE
ncbi:MAG: Sodium/hydrogen exchanger [Microgenomates group bacterium Gr01-1014_80]|nr:MAG: Sodium/hydrogen exchanger [Microgenomates group bacterium Gr01-1014_80]